MSETAANSSNDLAGADDQSLSRRRQTADRLPFILRAWWLRNYQEYADVAWAQDYTITGPVWSQYTDPLCDSGNLDFP